MKLFSKKKGPSVLLWIADVHTQADFKLNLGNLTQGRAEILVNTRL